MAEFYRTGRADLTADSNMAFKFYLMAAERGHAEGMYRTSLMLLGGKGCERSEPDAKMWMEKSAGKGFELAERRFARW